MVMQCAINTVLAQPPGRAPQSTVQLNFAEEMPLDQLADYVSARLGFNIIYDQQVLSKKVAIKSPAPVPAAALLSLLESSLQIHGLTLVSSGDGTWKTIVAATDLAGLSEPLAAPGSPAAEANARNRPVTRVFSLHNATPARIEPVIKPFLTKPGGNVVPLADLGLIIVTDFANTMQRIERLVEVADQPLRPVEVRFVPVEHGAAPDLASQLKQVLEVRAKAGSAGAPPGGAALPVEVLAEERTNRLILVGIASEIQAAVELFKTIDIAVSEEHGPVRFYQVYNTTAAKIVDTIRLIQGEQGGSAGASSGSTASSSRAAGSHAGGPQRSTSNSGSSAGSGWQSNLPGLGSPISTSGQGPLSGLASGMSSSSQPSSSSFGTGLGTGSPWRESGQHSSEPEEGATSLAIGTGQSVVHITADPNTNSIIIVGNAAAQQTYGELIRHLDRRRAQVLVEITMVILDTSKNFSLGVEVSAHVGGDPKAFLFSQFGLSTRDPTTGRPIINPGTGFNGAIVSSNIADMVIRALDQTGRARVVSAPKLLVSDHGTGRIASTTQQPFESVNASTTVATTTFGGFVEAGTAIEVTPHISDDNHLQLDYSVELSSFKGERIANLPPPRQENTLDSSVTLPDGETVIIGGLTRDDFSDSRDAVPILGDAPLLGPLFSSTTKSSSHATLFVFIRPVVLRDDRFADLKYLSEIARKDASLPDPYPSSQPMQLR